MIILDMPSDIFPQYGRLDSFFGQPFIWTMLHNFGGNVAMYGALTTVNEVMDKHIKLLLVLVLS